MTSFSRNGVGKLSRSLDHSRRGDSGQGGHFAPNLIAKLAIRFIRSSVQARAGFDIKELSPIEHADKCYIPVMFEVGVITVTELFYEGFPILSRTSATTLRCSALTDMSLDHTAEEDMFVSPHHSELIHARYAGDQNLVIVPAERTLAR